MNQDLCPLCGWDFSIRPQHVVPCGMTLIDLSQEDALFLLRTWNPCPVHKHRGCRGLEIWHDDVQAHRPMSESDRRGVRVGRILATLAHWGWVRIRLAEQWYDLKRG